MEQKINIAKLLKDCPSGMELDCMMYENLYFNSLNVDYYNYNINYNINCYTLINGIKTSINFTKYGTFNNHVGAKCVIFPKGKTTWEGFVPPCKFKDGDIIFTHADCAKVGFGHTWISIFEENRNGGVATYVDYCNEDKDFYTYLYDKGLLCMKEDIVQQRLATEEEKQRLFDVIKAKGYMWNSETNTLDKLIVPKFKVGDEIVKRNSISNSWIVNSVSSEYYGLKLPNGFEGIGVLPVSEQDDWELVHNKLEKLVEPKFKVGDVIQDEDAYKVTITEVNVEDKLYEYESMIAKGIGGIAFNEQDNWKLVSNKFDINTLKPFESKVLVRHHQTSIWMPAIFGGYDIPNLSYYAVGGTWWKYCIPYKGNEHLRGTVDDCSNYYKTWE